MSVKVDELMTDNVITVHPHETIEHARNKLSRNKINTLVVVDTDEQPVGMLSSKDLLRDLADGSPVSQHMTPDPFTVPRYADTQVAARMMRNHKIHHLVVTHEKKVVGVISAFDLLRLVEDHRYTPKNPSTPKKSRGKRAAQEN